MIDDDARLGTDRSRLQDVQYRTDANLAARQAIYAYQYPRLDLPAAVLGLASLLGDETVADIGCGNGAYLAELARHRHTGQVLGVDLSVGMLRAARSRVLGASLIAGDAAHLPLRDDASGLTLAMHMLYHVPEPSAAVRELRRVTGPRRQVLVVLNGHDHLRELRDLIIATLRDFTKGEPHFTNGEPHFTKGEPHFTNGEPHFTEGEPHDQERLRLDDGEELLATRFRCISRHDFISELRIRGRQPVEDYVRSMSIAQELPDPQAFAVAVGRLVPGGGTFRVRTHSGCLICS
jgi:SAM-dependent methyltransferase